MYLYHFFLYWSKFVLFNSIQLIIHSGAIVYIHLTKSCSKGDAILAYNPQYKELKNYTTMCSRIEWKNGRNSMGSTVFRW